MERMAEGSGPVHWRLCASHVVQPRRMTSRNGGKSTGSRADRRRICVPINSVPLTPQRDRGREERSERWSGPRVARHGRGQLEFHGTVAHLANPGEFHATLAAARSRDWVVYAKRPFRGPEQVFRYLARYTHRIAISDRRIVAFDGENVIEQAIKPESTLCSCSCGEIPRRTPGSYTTRWDTIHQSGPNRRPRLGEPAPSRRVRSGADRAGQVFEIAAGDRGNARHFRKRPARWRQGVADAPLKRRVGAVEVRGELGRPAQIGAGCEDAEAATQPRHAGE